MAVMVLMRLTCECLCDKNTVINNKPQCGMTGWRNDGVMAPELCIETSSHRHLLTGFSNFDVTNRSG